MRWVLQWPMKEDVRATDSKGRTMIWTDWVWVKRLEDDAIEEPTDD